MRSQIRFFTFFLFLISTQLHAQKTEIKYLSGTGKDNTINCDFQLTTGRNSGRWTTIPVPCNWNYRVLAHL